MASLGSLSSLKQLSAESRKQYGKAERTQKSYASYIQRGKAWLVESAAERRAREEEQGVTDDIDMEAWEKAFDYPPNKYSALALELFLTKRCLQEGLSRSTAEVIQAAFADYWDNM